jgi:hypothetical protein
MATQKTTTSSRSRQDLLSTVKRNPQGIGDDYVSASDFYISPDLNNEDFYPSRDNGILQGGSPSKYFGGNIPVYVGQGSVYPLAVAAKRQRAMDEAALKAKMYNVSVDEKKKDAEAAAEKGVKGWEYKEVPATYNENFNLKTIQGIEDIKNKYLNDPKYPSKTEAYNAMSADGSELVKYTTARRAFGDNLNQLQAIAKDVATSRKAGDFIPNGLQSAISGFYSGDMDKDPDATIKGMTTMFAGNNLLPEMNALSSQFTPTEKNGFKEVEIENVIPSAKGLVMKEVEGSNGENLALSLGLAANATPDQMTTELASQIVQRHGTQRDKPKEQSDGAGGVGKYDRFTWDNAGAPTPEMAKKLAESNSPYLHDGYSFQYLSVGGEAPPSKTWNYTQSIDPITGEVNKEAGAVTGSLIGINPVFNTDSKKLEWMAIISDPAHKETVTTYDKKDASGKWVPVPKGTAGAEATTEDIQTEEKIVAIPYKGNENKIEVHTRDKRGQNGFTMSADDIKRVDEVNKKTSGGSSTKSKKVTSDGSDAESWDKANEYVVGENIYFFDGTQWSKRKK